MSVNVKNIPVLSELGPLLLGPSGLKRAFALDLGGATLEEPTDLEIVVVDQNDNRPVFRQEAFTGRVLEGAVPGERELGGLPRRGCKSVRRPRVLFSSTFRDRSNSLKTNRLQEQGLSTSQLKSLPISV